MNNRVFGENGLLATAFVALTWALVGVDEAPAQDREVNLNSKTINVHCNQPNAPLARALSMARPGDTILLHGTCTERLMVEQGPLTIRGESGAVIDGSDLQATDEEYDALVTVRGASGVSLQNLAVQNFEKVGILAEQGAGINLDGVGLSGFQRGIVLSSATLTISNVIIEGGSTGLQATTGSTVVVRGDLEITGTGLEAFTLIGSSGELRGGVINIHENHGLNVVVVGNSALTLNGIPPTAQTHLTVNNNQGPGFLLANGTLEIGAEEPESPVIEAVDNAAPGFILTGAARLISAAGWARVISSGNAVGIVAEAGSTVWMQGGLEISGNLGPGLVASDISLTLATGINPVAIENNLGPDVILDFGTRSTLGAGVVIGSPLLCDPTVLSRGDTTCP